MNQYITDIVRIDRECQEKIAAVKKERASVSDNLTQKKEELYEAFAKEYEQTIAAKKADLQVQIDTTKAANQRDYEMNLQRLEETYNKHKDDLVAQLVARCLSDEDQ